MFNFSAYYETGEDFGTFIVNETRKGREEFIQLQRNISRELPLYGRITTAKYAKHNTQPSTSAPA